MLEHLQTHRQILFDLTANYLDALDGVFSRLAYVSGLREPVSGHYVHERLAALYGTERVNEVVARSHEEVFERLLEMPLDSQEGELRRYVRSLPGPFVENLQHCRERAMRWIPPRAPCYLAELYSSNLQALLELLLDSASATH